MKKHILEALKTKFDGISEQILSRIAEKLAKTVLKEEDVAAAVEAVTYQSIIESEADRRATEASQTSITNYEKKHGLKDGQKIKGEEKDPSGKTTNTDEDDDNLKAITEAIANAIKPLQEEITSFKTGKLSETRKQKLDAIIKDLPENIKKPYGRISLTDMNDEDFEAFLTETTAEVGSIVSEIKTKGSAFTLPLGGGGITKKEASAEEADAVLNNIMN
ncbi:MAG: hypothetical protein LBK94_00805 [Prevotellaceae bacterium]|jgi:hypothetical protein|nr:hypothetical protein [Prevotellaceae bacterium]